MDDSIIKLNNALTALRALRDLLDEKKIPAAMCKSLAEIAIDNVNIAMRFENHD